MIPTSRNVRLNTNKEGMKEVSSGEGLSSDCLPGNQSK